MVQVVQRQCGTNNMFPLSTACGKINPLFERLNNCFLMLEATVKFGTEYLPVI